MKRKHASASKSCDIDLINYELADTSMMEFKAFLTFKELLFLMRNFSLQGPVV